MHFLPNLQAVGAGLELRARGGAVSFSSTGCNSVELCKMAKQLDAVSDAVLRMGDE